MPRERSPNRDNAIDDATTVGDTIIAKLNLNDKLKNKNIGEILIKSSNKNFVNVYVNFVNRTKEEFFIDSRNRVIEILSYLDMNLNYKDNS